MLVATSYKMGSSIDQSVLAAEPGLDSRHALYESAVQSPKGDISYLLCFYQRYIGQQVMVAFCRHLAPAKLS